MVVGKKFGFERYGDVDVFEEKEATFELTDKKNVLIKVERASVNPIDITTRKGLLAKGKPLERFRVLGNEVQGEIIELSDSDSQFSVGDKVIALVPSGGDAEYLAVAQKNVFKIPSNMSLDVAATFPMVAETALWTLDSHFYALKEGDVLAIVGASGSVGSVALQLAQAKNITIIAVGSKRNETYLKELGADITVDYRNEEEIAAHKNSADYVINASLFNQGEDVAVALVKETGTILGLNGAADTSSKPEVTSLFLQRTKEMTNQAAIPQLMAHYEKKPIQVKIGHHLPLSLEGIKEAHQLFEDKKGTGKIILIKE
ncbi:NADP-dependent oxidoreductase [Vagococcus carniphilus]|uniref:NADP-dependent oxidoreductase n=1 Tax=Vagococcus carniphilus TaxID=218144 RepID=UPI0028911F48|nr:NADP-dependent oxidoreductase [Vagococcus carniphilus]MDT2864372.1 NADP-dependent oxidoreductase [Vagococcus carniphilus]